jgi:ATPase subunit of ABC transporter with duplicated ATPase domains
MKTCTKCGESKPETEFYKEARALDGLRSSCKACMNADNTKWNAANREKRRAITAKCDAANREKKRAAGAEYRASNPEKQRERHAKYHAAHPEMARLSNHSRRARQREAGGKLSMGLSDKLFKLQRGKCACGCRQPLGDDYHLDHRMPLALGGPNTDDNIQLLRSICNKQKNKKHPVDFMRERGYLI